MRRAKEDPARQRPDGKAAPVSAGKRMLFAVLALFVAFGVVGITVFMGIIMPRQYRRQAQRLYAPILQQAQTGTRVTLGAYEQDGDAADGKEPIEWIVLERQENRLLLVSAYALEYRPYHKKDTLTTWDDSSIRDWLNDTFYDEAFSPAEKRVVLRSEVLPDKNEMFDSAIGEATTDRLFLLSISEATEYLPQQEQRLCSPTAYAVQKGASAQEGSLGCLWWLRTPGYDNTAASRVLSDGSISFIGQPVGRDLAVRPAMWVTCTP